MVDRGIIAAMAKEITVPEPVKIVDVKGEMTGILTPAGRVMLADPCPCTNKKRGDAVKLGEGDSGCPTCAGKGMVAGTLTFPDFCEQVADDAKFQKSIAALRASTALVHQSLDRKPGESFKLTDTEHKIVCDVLSEMSDGHVMVPVVARCAMRGGFYDAILGAKDA